MNADRTPLYRRTDKELEAIVRGECDEEYGPEAHQARATAATILVNRQQQRTNPQAFRR